MPQIWSSGGPNFYNSKHGFWPKIDFLEVIYRWKISVLLVFKGFDHLFWPYLFIIPFFLLLFWKKCFF